MIERHVESERLSGWPCRVARSNASWTSRAAGIDRTIIFPINNPTYEKANEAIAEMCGRYPGKLIGFAKHDPQTEAGRVPAMLRREVEELVLKGLKLQTRDMLDAVAERRPGAGFTRRALQDPAVEAAARG